MQPIRSIWTMLVDFTTQEPFLLSLVKFQLASQDKKSFEVFL